MRRSERTATDFSHSVSAKHRVFLPSKRCAPVFIVNGVQMHRVCASPIMPSFLLFASSLLLSLGLSSVWATTNVIVPGAKWNDTSGNSIQAHGGGFLKVSVTVATKKSTDVDYGSQVGSTIYWFGEDKSHNSALFKAVSCYTVRQFTPTK